MEQEKRSRDHVLTPDHPTPRSKTASESSSSDVDDDASSDDDIFGETQKKTRRVLDDDDDKEEISDKIADDTNTTTIADDAETTAHRGGNVVTPRRFHAGHGTLQEAGVNCSGNSTLLHELHSRTSLTHLVSQYNTI